MSDSIPVSTVVNVSISTTPAAPSRAGFGVGLIVTQEAGITLLDGVKNFASMDEVKAVYNSTTEAYKAAQSWFSQSPAPTSVSIGRRFTTAQAGFLRCGGDSSELLTDYTAITAGKFKISIDGVTAADCGPVNLSGAASLTAVAALLQTAIRAMVGGSYATATCTYDTVNTVFVITSGSTGASSSVSYLSAPSSGTDISDLLKGRQGSATKVNGIAAESTVAACLDRLQSADPTWYFFGFTKETRDNQDAQDASAWAEAHVKQFFTVINNEDAMNGAIQTDIGYVLNAAGKRRTLPVFSTHPSEYPEFSAAARAATVDFGGIDTTLTLKFKKLPGVTYEKITSAQASALKAKGINVFVKVGDYTMLQEGQMSAGVGVWQDTVHGVDWLQNAVETNIFAYLATRSTKVPYTDEGGAALEQQIESALAEGVRNGLTAKSGYDSNGIFLPKGYKITVQPVKNATLSQKSQRQFPSISFQAIGAGAIHGVQVNGLFEG